MVLRYNSISGKNIEYWNELCGSGAARMLGITDASITALKKFDEWYFDYYAYLFEHIPFDNLCDNDILEVGLGYGTVSQRLMEGRANYTGMDIAPGPVLMVDHRIRQNNLSGRVVQGNILEPPFLEKSFDTIIAIGCLHHTGNLKLAIDQCWRLLRSGGFLIFMVYYAYSYRRIRLAFAKSLWYMAQELKGYRGVVGMGDAGEREVYDGGGTPYTDWISVRSLRNLCGKFSYFSATIENISQEPPFSKTPRRQLLTTRWPSIVGLDLYATVRK